MTRERRRYYRLRYPEAWRPTATVDGRGYPLVELSVGGIRILDDQAERPVATVCVVELHIDGLAPITIRDAVVLRHDGSDCVIGLPDGIPHEVVFREQRRMIRRARRGSDPEALATLRTWPPPLDA